jgi:hypothetical protein
MDDILSIIVSNIKCSLLNKKFAKKVYGITKNDQYKLIKGLITTGNADGIKKYSKILNTECVGWIDIIKVQRFSYVFAIMQGRDDLLKLFSGKTKIRDFNSVFWICSVLGISPRNKTIIMACNYWIKNFVPKNYDNDNYFRLLEWITRSHDIKFIYKIFKNFTNLSVILNKAIEYGGYRLIRKLIRYFKIPDDFIQRILEEFIDEKIQKLILQYQNYNGNIIIRHISRFGHNNGGKKMGKIYTVIKKSNITNKNVIFET